MGRRSRKRATADVLPPAGREAPAAASGRGEPARPAPPAPRAPTYRARMDEAPKAAWAPVPLTEICILAAIVLIVLGFSAGGDRRGVMLGGGFALVTLAAGELALREHFAGFRSHSALLAGICAIAAALPVWLTKLPQEAVLLVGIAVFVGAFVQFRRAFARRSGGLGFRA